MRDEIREQYSQKKEEIETRMREFRQLREAGDERLFKELVFVLLTSQSHARDCWEAAEELDRRGLLEDPGKDQVSAVLAEHGVQYEERKAEYIKENRSKLSRPTLEDSSGSLKLSDRIDPDGLESTREWLVENLKGIGWKGASHFLRNIGCGNSFAIISSHIVRRLSGMGIIDERPSSRQEYLKAEEKLQQLASELGIPVQELDLVLWSMETGEVFK